jgi:hypothetical protein
VVGINKRSYCKVSMYKSLNRTGNWEDCPGKFWALEVALYFPHTVEGGPL